MNTRKQMEGLLIGWYNLKEVVGEDNYAKLDEFFFDEFHISFDDLVAKYQFGVMNAYELISRGCGLRGVCKWAEKQVIVADYGFMKPNPDLGIIVHEYVHAVQNERPKSIIKKTVYILRQIWNNNVLRSKEHRRKFYTNEPIEIEARDMADKFARRYNMTGLLGGNL